MTTPLLRAEHLSRHFKIGGALSMRTLHAVDDVNFQIGEHEIVALAGESGSGKSTIARLLARVYRPTSGEVYFSQGEEDPGTPLSAMRSRRARLRYSSEVPMVFQDPFASINPVFRVSHGVLRSLKLHRPDLSAKERQAEAARVFEVVGLDALGADLEPARGLGWAEETWRLVHKRYLPSTRSCFEFVPAAGSLIENAAGDFFGAANSGGASSSGTVFEYSHLGVFSLVHTFTGTANDGSRPNSELVQASDGLIYGVTVRGGSMGAGSLFRFNPADFTTFNTFSSFAPTGQSDPDYNPTFGMTEGTDGALYGLTAEGGTGYGSVYKVEPGTTPTVTFDLYDLVSFSDGGLPASSMTLGGDGNFYATASSYGPGGPPNGTIFRFLPSGTVSLNTGALSFAQGASLSARLRSRPRLSR